MSIEEKVQAAWEQQCRDDELSPNLSPEKREGFELGYRAALRGLFVEVAPKEVRPDITYMMLIDGEWHERRVVMIELLKVLARESEKIYRVNLPSPSEIFGEGGRA